jgi:hypothetical protein
MATYTETLNTNYNFPNIDIYNRYKDGTLCAYRVYPHDGYVMYDTNDYHTEINPDTMEEIPVTHYYTMAGLSLNYNFDNFSWVAVLRSEVDENYIFGVGDNKDHETM